jgi:CheY-like chemotaxis protein
VQSLNCRVMVVDDSETEAFLLSQVLMLMGHTVEQVRSGKEALNRINAFSPNVILSDLHMADKPEGHDLARNVRTLDRGRIVLVAVMGSEGAETPAEAMASGFDICLGKPIEITHLQTVFESLGYEPTSN